MNVVFLVLIAIGLLICVFPQPFGRGVSSVISHTPAPVQSFYRAGSFGHDYGSDYWARYYRFAGGALVLALGALWFTRRG